MVNSYLDNRIEEVLAKKDEAVRKVMDKEAVRLKRTLGKSINYVFENNTVDYATVYHKLLLLIAERALDDKLSLGKLEKLASSFRAFGVRKSKKSKKMDYEKYCKLREHQTPEQIKETYGIKGKSLGGLEGVYQRQIKK